MKKKLGIVLAMLLLLMVSLSGCGSANSKGDSDPKETNDSGKQVTSDSDNQTAAEEKKWKVALSNSFVGNDYRQEMQKIAQYVAESDKYKDQVQLDIINCENTAEAQAASIDALVLQGYDAILIDASSPTALNGAISRAAAKGIIVISFDQIVTAPEAIKLGTDFGEVSRKMAEYLVAAIGGKGNIVVDRGLAGANGSRPMYDEPMKVFAEYPDIKVIAEFDGNYSQGDTLTAMNAIVAANPKIDAVYTQGYADSAIQALKSAGRPLVPVSGFLYNCSMLALAENDCDGIQILNPASLGATAMVMALNELNGVETYDRTEQIPATYEIYAMNPDTVDLGMTVKQIELNENAFPDMPSGFQMPFMDPIVGVDVPLDIFK